jgi:hypothetical protein
MTTAHDGALDGGANHQGEVLAERALMLGAQRHRRADTPHQVVPVAQQEEQEIEHDEEADHDVECALPDTQGLRGNELTAAQQPFGDPVLHGGQLGEVEALQQP